MKTHTRPRSFEELQAIFVNRNELMKTAKSYTFAAVDAFFASAKNTCIHMRAHG